MSSDFHQVESGAIATAVDHLFTTADPGSGYVEPVEPGTGSSGGGGRLEATHLLTEIEPMVDKLAGVDTGRRAIGGISRGGGLALEIAGFEPRAFVAAGGHSAVPADTDALDGLAVERLPVFLDVGREDSLTDASTGMSERITEMGGDVELHVWDGGHNRLYWAAHTTDYLRFYGRYLGANS